MDVHPAPLTTAHSPKQSISKFNPGTRPYRSHKLRACGLCRRRKSRCIVDVPTQPCLTCRVQGPKCLYEADSSDKRTPRVSRLRQEETSPQITLSKASASGASQNESVLVLGPVATEDARVIRDHMSSQSPDQLDQDIYSMYSGAPRKTVLYTKIPRQRQGTSMKVQAGEEQREVIEQILGPVRYDLVRLYVDSRIPCRFRDRRSNLNEKFHPSFQLCISHFQ